jgi:uncharacterized RDD family membrane protein YckC
MSGAIKPENRGQKTIKLTFGPADSGPEPQEFPFEFGGYRLLGLLGRGGMGTVYEAEQHATGRRVALKVLTQQLDSPDLRHRFLREGRLAAGIRHPHSLYVFGSEEIEGAPAISMEVAGSGTLKDKLKKRGPLPVKEAVDAILDVIAGLEAAFDVGVLHRDIKPSNCFVSPDGSVKIGDFGISLSTLARDDSYVTATGVIMGTPAFASPEQLRGDNLDVRADIYSVGATLFTLLTNRAPFEGENAVQVVAHAVNEKPKALTEFRKDVPPGLERVVARCLAKEPAGRYADYRALRNALLPFSSQVPESATMEVRALAGWIDYLAALVIPYVVIMLSVGGAEFQLQPLVDRTLYSARYYFLFLSLGFLYFGITEGFWGAGLGKRLLGLSVVRMDGRLPGVGRALLRLFIPLFCIEIVRVPLLLTTISLSDVNMTSAQVWLYVGISNVCPWLAVLMVLRARRENGFATVWDHLTGTRVVVQLKGTVRAPLEPTAQFIEPREDVPAMGPYQVVSELVAGKWLVAFDALLRRPVWLFRESEPTLPLARKNVARMGRLRWLQTIETNGARWNAFEAAPGTPFSSLVKDGRRLPWETLRQWLHDLAAELWAATSDKTLPAQLSLDHIWITRQGHAVLLDHPWPEGATHAECIRVSDLAGQQRFLSAVAACAETTTLPLHARPVLQNLAAGKFEKLSFLTGHLRGLLDKPAEVTRQIRAGCLLLLPVYIWIMVFVGYEHPAGGPETIWTSAMGTALATALVVLGSIAVAQLLELPFRSTASYAIFRLAVINSKGERASALHQLGRWAIMWLPLLLLISLVLMLVQQQSHDMAFFSGLGLLLLWIGVAAYGTVNPYRGLQDRLAGTWVVRR